MQKFFVLKQYQYGIFVKFRTWKISRLWCYTACILPQSQSHCLRSKILKYVFLTWAPFSPCIPGKPSIPGEPGGPVGPCTQWAQMEGMKLLLHCGSVSQILLTHHISWRSSSPWRTHWSSWTRWTRGTLRRREGHEKSCWQCQTLFHLIGFFSTYSWSKVTSHTSPAFLSLGAGLTLCREIHRAVYHATDTPSHLPANTHTQTWLHTLVMYWYGI